MSREISRQNLLAPDNRTRLEEFVRAKLFEYKLDEIGIYVEEEPLFSYLNPNLPLQDYQNLSLNVIKRAHLGELFSDIEPMGTGEFIRRGVSASDPRSRERPDHDRQVPAPEPGPEDRLDLGLRPALPDPDAPEGPDQDSSTG